MFTQEEEIDNILPFLHINISRENNSFVTSIYRKSTFSGVNINFDSFIMTRYKQGLFLSSLLYRCFHLCSDGTKFHHEMIETKNNLKEK